MSKFVLTVPLAILVLAVTHICNVQSVSIAHKCINKDSRIAISRVPFTISRPGSYFITRDLMGVASAGGITIDSSDVSLDLNGFTLRGVSGSLSGIVVPGQRVNIEVRNGGIRSWGSHGLEARYETCASMATEATAS